MVVLHFTYYNFARVHQTLRVRPAMEAKLAEHVRSIDEIIELAVQKISARISDFAVVPYSLDHSSRPDFHGFRREEPRHGG